MISIIWRGELNGSVRVWGPPTCEGCKSIDVRRLQRDKLLQPGRRFSWSWSRNGEPIGNISIETEDDAIVLDYLTRRNGTEWKDIRQRIPITWTACALGGRRPWFICAVYANGRYCGRRAAILYAGGDLFACRHCYGLSYLDFGAFEGSWSAFVSERLAYFRLKRTKSITPVATAAR